ncbi:MAG TPA: Clp protease N-terminal domain-containing protein, partial [Flexilinea sp.]|nr:Clp protease N-terminal domain-containing protein [Flexilinea sp.]
MAGIDRFTQRARRVLSLAHQEADKNNETIIGTEHLLIGLLLVEGSTAGKVLQDLDVSADRVREALSKMEPKTEILGIPEAGQEEALSAEVQDILKRAVIQASKNGQVYVSTEHLLLSLIETENSRAVAVLKRLGISPEQIRKQLKRVLEEGNSAPASNSTEEVKPKPVKKQRTDKTTSNSPLIDQLATDLTAKAAAGKLDPVVGRETEIARVIQVLA